MDRSPSSSLSFDEVCIDLAGHRLWHAGMERALEPKAFGVLALLAQSPGRVFTRDEILDAVWGHRHVTPGVLNRVITLLRHALGEDAHRPRYLHTVHGVGYRFDLPGTSLDAGAGSTPAAVEPGPPPIVSPAAEAAQVSSPARELRRRATDHAATHSPWRLVILLTLLAALLAFAGRHLWPPIRPAPATGTGPPTLVVMPLKPIGAGDGVRTIADGLSEELICSLARIEGLRVIARESTHLLAGSANDPAADARALGITHALEGNLQQSGQRLRVRLRLVEAGGGRLLWTRDFDRDATEALSLQRDIAEGVATSLSLRLGLSLPETRGGDTEFQRRFLGARTLAMRLDLPAAESVDPAATELRNLSRERPGDPRVRAWLAVTLRIQAFRHPEHGPALFEEAVREARVALRLDSSRYEPYIVLAADDCRQQRWESCTARLQHALALAPGLVYVHADMAAAMLQLGYLDRAEAHARASLARDPLNPSAHAQLARALDTLGKHAEAATHFRHAGPSSSEWHWLNAVRRRDAGAALRLAEGLADADAAKPRALGPKQPALAVSRALANPSLWPQALAESQRYERDNPGRMHVARLFAPDAAIPANALATQLVASRSRDSASFAALIWARDLAFLRRTPAFQRYLHDSGILAYWTQHGFPQQCRPLGNGAHCD